MKGESTYPVDSHGIQLADVDIMDGLFDRLDAIAAALPEACPRA
jgi:hypothetical protein